ncbi:peptidase C39 [Helicobacter trogontum]|uniref:Peptidase C39 n=2 Tax=Helicobacter trogontum TaxID=50960 RepID=A0A4U8TLP9_9HELI|nr:peptidase C39 [Helicobacter trogontum]
MKYFVFILCFTMAYSKAIITIDSVVIETPIKTWTQIRDSNLTKQEYDYSCGSASLSTILTYYYNTHTNEKDIINFMLRDKGIDINKKEEIEWNDDLREKASTSFLDLAKYAETRGFKTLGLALNMESLGKLKVPAILYVKARSNDHFSVYRGMDHYFVYLSDPSLGNIKISKEKFKEMFYQRNDESYPGKLLVILPKTNPAQINTDFMTIKHNINLIEQVIQDKSTMQ